MNFDESELWTEDDDVSLYVERGEKKTWIEKNSKYKFPVSFDTFCKTLQKHFCSNHKYKRLRICVSSSRQRSSEFSNFAYIGRTIVCQLICLVKLWYFSWFLVLWNSQNVSLVNLDYHSSIISEALCNQVSTHNSSALQASRLVATSISHKIPSVLG